MTLRKRLLDKYGIKEKDDLIVSCSDVHLTNDDSYGYYMGNGVNNRLELKFNLLKKVVDIAKALKAPFVFGGDLIDQRTIDSMTLWYTTEFIDYLRQNCSGILLGGNHEYNDAQAQFSVLKPFKFLTNFSNQPLYVATEANAYQLKLNSGASCQFVCAPAHQKLEDILEHIVNVASKSPPSDRRVLLIHGAIHGADMGSLPSSKGLEEARIEELSKEFDWIICGDFHKFQMVHHLKNVYYCGSLLQMNIGDRNQKRGYQIVNLTQNKLIHIDSGAPRFKKILWYPGKFVHSFIKTPEKFKEKIKNKIISIKMVGSFENIQELDFQLKKQELLKYGAIGVYQEKDIIRDKRNAVKIKPNIPKKEIITEYVQNKDFESSEKIRKRRIVMGENYVKMKGN